MERFIARVVGSAPAGGVTSSTAVNSSTAMLLTIMSPGVSLYPMPTLSYMCMCMDMCLCLYLCVCEGVDSRTKLIINPFALLQYLC